MFRHEADVEPGDPATGRRERRLKWQLIPLVVLIPLILLLVLIKVLVPQAAAAQLLATWASAANRAHPVASGSIASTEQITVAILAPLSGVASGFGASTRDGALLAINEWNAGGGVLGMRILPVIRDSQCNPKAAADAAHAVIDVDRAHYIVGEVCSGASIAISDIADAAHVVQITPVSTEPRVTVDDAGAVKPYVFRACLIDPSQGTAAARFARTDLRAGTAVILLNEGDSYSKGLANVFGQAFAQEGGRVVSRESYTLQVTDFSPVLARIAALKPDVVYLPDYYKAANLITGQAKKQGVTIPFIGSDGWGAPDLDFAATAGDYFTTHFAPDEPASEVQAFGKSYQNAYPGAAPDALAALSYDATNLLLEALKAAGADDAARVRDSLASIRFQGVTGQITFDALHNPHKAAVVMRITPAGPAFQARVNP